MWNISMMALVHIHKAITSLCLIFQSQLQGCENSHMTGCNTYPETYHLSSDNALKYFVNSLPQLFLLLSFFIPLSSSWGEKILMINGKYFSLYIFSRNLIQAYRCPTLISFGPFPHPPKSTLASERQKIKIICYTFLISTYFMSPCIYKHSMFELSKEKKDKRYM